MHEKQKQQRRLMIDSLDRWVLPDSEPWFSPRCGGKCTFTYAKTLSDARHRSGSSSDIQTIKRENADAFSLFMAGIAGLEPAMQESKSCALTDLAISHRYGVLYHIRRRCVKGGG